MNARTVHGNVTSDREESLFAVAAYLSSCAPLSVEETPALAAYRMVDATGRILTLMECRTPADAAFRDDVLGRIAAHGDKVMTDQPGFLTWLPELAELVAREAARRAAERPMPTDDRTTS